MLAIHYRPAHRHERRGAGRGGGLLGVAKLVMCVDLKKAGGDVCFPVRLSALLSDAIYALVVVVQIALLADDIAVRSARADMRVCVAWLELLAHAGTICSALDIQDGILGVLVRGDIDVLGEGLVECEEYGLAVEAFSVENINVVVEEFGHECDGGVCSPRAFFHTACDGGSVFEFGLTLTTEELVFLLCGFGGRLLIARDGVPYGFVAGLVCLLLSFLVLFEVLDLILMEADELLIEGAVGVDFDMVHVFSRFPRYNRVV